MMSSNFNISTDYGLFVTDKEVIKQIVLFYIKKEGMNPSELITDEFILDDLSLVEYVYNG